MAGFFDDIDFQITNGYERVSKRNKKTKAYSCFDCPQTLQCKKKEIDVFGKGKKKILIILDRPAAFDQEIGMPYQDYKHGVFKQLLENRTGLRVKRDCWTIFSVRCDALDNVTVLQREACRDYVHTAIKELAPNVIIPIGFWPMMSVSGDILTGKSRGKNCDDWQGAVIPDQRFGKWICPTHDVYMLKLEDAQPDKVRIDQLVEDIKRAIGYTKKQVKIFNYSAKINILTNRQEIILQLEKFLTTANENKGISLAMDYETTGRKPHREGHEIVSIAISDGEEAWSFIFDKNDTLIFNGFKNLLICPYIGWRVHNVQFEWLWSYNIFGAWPVKLEQDTILGIHVMNSRKRKGLKALIYMMFGVAGYDDVMDDFIKSLAVEDKLYGANGFNLMKQAPKKDCLLYNGLDALFTYKIADYITDNLRVENWIGYNFLMKSAVSLTKAQENGICINLEGIETAKKELEAEIVRLEVLINKLAVKEGWNAEKKFRPSAAADISELFFKIMKCESLKQTAGGGKSTDKETLEKINNAIAKNIVEWKKLQKLKDTYINGIKAETVDGIMHPFFNLYTVVTYRSSSDAFNFQNIPKRDKKSSKIIRDLLFPHEGHKIIEYDYKAVEVSVSACYNKDTNLIRYVSDPDTDMHKDTAIELFMYEDNLQNFQKEDRQVAKNKFVFPSFYGSYYKQTAPDLWEGCTQVAKDNLKRNGIRNIKGFTDHVRRIENDFWYKRFPEYTQWKKDVYNSYLKNGYTDSLTGFRYYGSMSRNEVLNTSIQGSAHHVLLRTFNNVSDVLEKKNMKSKIIGQIHDSMIISVCPNEERYVDKIVWYYGTQEIVEDFEWIIVPLQIEKSSGGVNMPWSSLKEQGLLGINGKIEP